MLVLDVEFNSLSDGTVFNRDHQVKNWFKVQIPGFWSHFFGKACPNSFKDLC